MKHPKRILYTIFGVLLLLIGTLCLRVYREAIRLEHNRALFRAIRQKDGVDVQILLRQGADPNAREIPTPPPATFQQRLLALLDLLRGRRPQPPPDAPSALMLAVQTDSAPIVTSLLDAGAKDVDARIEETNESTTTATPLLCQAAQAGNLEIVQALLNHGADREAKDTKGETALIMAASRNTLYDENSAIIPSARRYSAETKQTDIVRLLLERGTNIQAADSEGCTALAEAAGQDNLEMALLLLKRGANPNVPCGWRNETPLVFAARNENLPLINALLQKGAKMELPGTESPLLQTANPELMAFLLDHGTNIHAKVQNFKSVGETALIYLARWDENNSHLPAIRLLLARGADVNEREASTAPEGGEETVSGTALMYAAQYAGMDTIRCLLDHGAKVNMSSAAGPALLWAIEDERFDVARLLVHRGAHVNLPADEGTTPLIRTVEMGEEDFARELLERGADVNARDNQGRTALHIAAGNHDTMVELLLQWGAKVNARDKDGHTPLHHALYHDNDDEGYPNDEDYREVIALLRKAGAKE